MVGSDIGGVLLACQLAVGNTAIACAVAYGAPGVEALINDLGQTRVPILLHIAADDPARTPAVFEQLQAAATQHALVGVYVYPAVRPGFDNRNNAAYNRSAHDMARSRTLASLREVIGPKYDLAGLWDAHLYSEFAERDVDVSMATMVDEPYVLVVPTVTGGTGKKDLHRWYSHHFHFQNPEDTRIVPISRTVGSDRVVDEFIFCFTHDRVMDWILPGVPPTGKTVEIPMIAVVNFRGPKLYHEHIWWDQASVLVPTGLLKAEGLPVSGAEQAAAMQDEQLPRNTLIPGWDQRAGL